MIEIRDALERTVQIRRPPERIVSLVPSETVSVAELVGVDRLVGRTEYCIEPVGAIEQVTTVGGTKSLDVEAIVALGPDLVLANKEENARASVQKLIEAGLTVHVSFPCTVAESNRDLRTLCQMLGLDPSRDTIVGRCEEALARATSTRVVDPLPVCVPIWRDPWMTFDDRVFASDVLRLAGAANVFGDRPRLYPLAADLGRREPAATEKTEARDTRYPRIVLDEVVARGARAVLLPDEPYAFTEADFDAFVALGGPPLGISLVDGKDLFWYGSRVAGSLDRLRQTVASIVARLSSL